MMILVTGGSGSGKSAYAEGLVLEQGEQKRIYIATMRPWDEECQKKIEKHRRMRAEKQFETIECYQDLHQLEVEAGSVVLLECMSNLAANEFFRQEGGRSHARERILNGIEHLQKQAKAFMIVTNEVFSDGGTYDEDTRAYMELLGNINQELAHMADQVIEVVYGIPVAVRQKMQGRKL